MRFPTIFRRRVGTAPSCNHEHRLWFEGEGSLPGMIPELGSDKLPQPGQQQPERYDNLHESRLVNVNGFPGQRVCVGYQGPERAPALLAEMVLYDETSRTWFRVPASPPTTDSTYMAALVPGALAYFDPPCLLDHSRAKRGGDDESHMSGSLEVLLLVHAESPDGESLAWRTDPDGKDRPEFPEGIYTFVVGTDVSNPA